VIGHDGSYMPHLDNNICTCATVFYCSHTNQSDVTWVEKSTKKAAYNYRAKIMVVGGAIIKLAIFFLAEMTFLCMNSVDIGATMPPLNFFEKFYQVCPLRSVLRLLTRD
jgi:hypothetical protein